jgi:hypothetical protein
MKIIILEGTRTPRLPEWRNYAFIQTTGREIIRAFSFISRDPARLVARFNAAFYPFGDWEASDYSEGWPRIRPEILAQISNTQPEFVLSDRRLGVSPLPCL